MLNKLFSSKVRVELLKLFLFNPDNSFYQRELALRTSMPIRGVQREVERLASVGLITRFTSGNRVYYKVNKKCPIYEELKKIVLKTAGIAEVIRGGLTDSQSIRVAFIYGSYAKGEEDLSSDIDLLVIGDISSKQLSALLSGPKRELGRAIDYVVFPVKELNKRIEQKNHFLSRVMKEKKVFIVGSDDELKQIIKRG